MRQGTAAPESHTTRERRYELDWLRTLVVLGLIPVHTASLFTPTPDLFLKEPQTSGAMVMVGAFVGVFGMPLLFFVAGASSWYALGSRTNARYARERVARLLVPLIFATLAIVPIQVYLVAQTNPGLASGVGAPIYDPRYLESFLRFYPQYLLSYAYFLGHPSVTGFIAFIGHLWFILYLFVFSLVALPLFSYLRSSRGARLLDGLARFSSQPGALFTLAAPLILVDAAAHALWTGVGAVSEILLYLMCFIYGYALYSDARVRQAIRRQWLIALALGFALWVIAETSLAPHPRPLYDNSMGAILNFPLRSVIAWFWVIGLLGFGLAFLSRTSRALRYLSDVAYPIYVLHVTAIIAVGYVLLQWQAPLLVKYVVIMIAALIVLLAVIEFAIKPFAITRRLFGMRAAPPVAASKPPPRPQAARTSATA